MTTSARVMAASGGIRDRITVIITAGLMMVVTAGATLAVGMAAAEMVVVGIDETNHVYRAKGRRFRKTRSGFKHNCFEGETGAEYWISGPKRRGGDKLYGGVVEIDEDARVEYWTKIRCGPGAVH